MSGTFPLLVKSPRFEWLGGGAIAVTLRGGKYSSKAGRGHGLQFGSAGSAAFWKQEGKNGEMALRLADDLDLSLEVAFRKMNVGDNLDTWFCNGHREWACRFQLNSDGSLSPSKNSGVFVGVKKGDRRLCLVGRGSPLRILFYDWTKRPLPSIFSQIRAEKDQMKKMMTSLGGEAFPLAVVKPKCSWLWGDNHAIVVNGGGYGDKNGRGIGIKIGPAEDAILFRMDGTSPQTMALRLSHDKDLALEVNWRKMEVGTALSAWCNKNHPEWALRFTLNSDWTISPESSPNLVLGVQYQKEGLQLVSRDDEKQRLVFQPFKQAAGALRERVEAKRKEKAAARARVEATVAKTIDAKTISKLKRDGFVHLPGVVDKTIVNSALREINRLMGSSTEGGADKFKAKFSPTSPPITNLFNNSAIPLIIQRLLGMPSAPRQGAGQIALRFPGDFCANGRAEVSLAQYEGVRKGWHIDGCPSKFIPGVTDHWGEIHNFDALCGVLLSSVDEKMSGELCCYPGSHYDLARHFKAKGFKETYTKGKLPNGNDTDSVLTSSKTKPVHCLGKPGDVFIANYMTAHFIAPNVSPNIRYAVYFRVRGPSFTAKKHHPEPMLQPWINWKGVNGGSESSGRKGAEKSPAASAEEGSAQTRVAVLNRLASIDYVRAKSMFFDDGGDDVNPE